MVTVAVQICGQTALLQESNQAGFKNAENQLVSNFVTILNGYAFKSSWFVKDGIRLLRNANVGHGRLNWVDTARVSEDKALEFHRFKLDEGDLVISLDRPIISTGLKIARVTKHDLPCLLLQSVGKVEFKTDKVLPEFFFLWLNSPLFIRAIDPGRSNGVPHISSKSIESLPFNPPPNEEQKRIVEKCDRILILCDEIEKRQQQRQASLLKMNEGAVSQLLTAQNPDEFQHHWQRLCNNFDLLYSIPETIPKLRQAILQLAVQGKLVPQNPNDEPASVNLTRLQSEKDQLIKRKVIQRAKVSGIPSREEIPFNIPTNWEWRKADDLCFVTKLAGFEYTEYFKLSDVGEVPVVRAQNVRMAKIDDTNLLYIDLETSKKLERSALTKPAILMTFIGAGIGDVAVIEPNQRWHLAPNVAKLEPFNGDLENININYILLFLMSDTGRKEIFKHRKSTAQPSLSMGTIRDINVAIPPLAEQKRIVAKVDALLSLCDALEAKLKAARDSSATLMEIAAKQILVA